MVEVFCLERCRPNRAAGKAYVKNRDADNGLAAAGCTAEMSFHLLSSHCFSYTPLDNIT
jgi:hypothetical protein